MNNFQGELTDISAKKEALLIVSAQEGGERMLTSLMLSCDFERYVIAHKRIVHRSKYRCVC